METQAKFNCRHFIVCGALLLGASGGARACGPEAYTGQVCFVAMNWCPNNTMAAEGQLLPINNYQALYSLIGTTYGGDARTTFGLPDLRGRAPVHAGQPPGMDNVPFGKPLGQQAVTVNANQLPAHVHPAAFTGTGGGQVTVPATPGNLSVTASLPVSTTASGSNTLSSGSNYIASMSGSLGASSVKFTGPFTQSAPAAPAAATLPANVTVTGTAGAPAITFNSGITGGAVAVGPNATSNAAVPTQSPALAMTACIVLNGYYPTRP
jgi:microcystin-dependent protein